LRIVALCAPLDCVSAVLMNSHLGAGSSRTVLVVSVLTQWGLFLPVAWLLGVRLGFGLVAIWLAQSLTRMIGVTLFAQSWRRRAWARVSM
jgi:Na+-driven multidrug efflux pump